MRRLTAKVFYCTCAEFFFSFFFFFLLPLCFVYFAAHSHLFFLFRSSHLLFPDIVRLHRLFVVVSTIVSFLVSSSDVQPFPVLIRSCLVL